MFKQKKYIITLLLSVMIYHFLWVLDPILSYSYDLLTQQNKVEEFSTHNFQLLKFKDLPQKEQSKYQNGTCSNFNYDDATFLEVSWFNRYQNIIGTTKAYKLLTPDRLISNRIRIPNLDKTQYLLIDSKVISIYQKLMAQLEEDNLNTDEVFITSGFRNPEYNKMVGGATCSQHQLGTALDISVGDLNNDGIADKTDRSLIYEILENSLIQNNGGIGKYKNHPKLIHFDTRGNRARW